MNNFKHSNIKTFKDMIIGTKECVSYLKGDTLYWLEGIDRPAKSLLNLVVCIVFILLFPITVPVITYVRRKVTIQKWQRRFKYTPFDTPFDIRYSRLKQQIKRES